MKSQKGFTLFELLVALIFIIGSVGWIWNIVRIVQNLNEFTPALLVRIVGVFVAPLGAILGYIPF